MEAIGNLTGGMAMISTICSASSSAIWISCGKLARTIRMSLTSREAVDAALRGADLTRRMLAFARRQPLQPERVELNQLVSGMVKLLSRLLGEDIAISLDLADNLWPVVVDPAQLDASFTNLATNARDAMSRGGKLTIVTANRHLDDDYATTHALVTPGAYAMIEVTDTGTGMTQETRSHEQGHLGARTELRRIASATGYRVRSSEGGIKTAHFGPLPSTPCGQGAAPWV
jgi:C4-dicarboxylate-specific signal transduction histidine kinase